MKFIEYAKEYVPKINEEIKSVFDKRLDKVNNRFLKDYYNELSDYFLSGGKRIRPLTCIAAYNAFCKTDPENISKASIGTEFLHNASLIHDDIIDKDDYRRGKPSFHYRFRKYHAKYDLKKMVAEDYGNDMGILGGDSSYFFGLGAYNSNGFEDDLNFQAIQYYEQAFHEVCDGVLIEIDMVNKANLTMDDYIEMISLKTGALIEKSIIIGANYAGVDKNKKKLLSTYGKNLGIIFQIIDDILGTFGDEKVTGKPTDGDIREGKKTALLITALDAFSGESKDKLIELSEKQDITDEEVIVVRELFKEADAVESAKDLATLYYEEAKNALEDLKSTMRESEIEFFENLLKFVLERNF
ncbi:MAG: polyprenyl synthetase family protein [Promethearchaeota archaeon]